MWKHLIPLLLFFTTTCEASTTYTATLSKTKSGLMRIQTPKTFVTPVNCGGVGELVETRVSGCDQLPCTLTYSSTIEIDFFPSVDSMTPRLRITLTPNSTGIPESEEGFLGGEGFGLGLEVEVEDETPLTITLTHFQQHVTREELVMEIQILNDNLEREVCISGRFNPGLGLGLHAPSMNLTMTTTTPITSKNQAVAFCGQFTAILIMFLSVTQIINNI